MDKYYDEYIKYRNKVQLIQQNKDVQWVAVEHIPSYYRYKNREDKAEDAYSIVEMNVGKSGVLKIPSFINRVQEQVIANQVSENVKIIHRNNRINDLSYIFQFQYSNVRSLDLTEFDFTNVECIDSLLYRINTLEQIKLPNIPQETSRNIKQAVEAFKQLSIEGELDLQGIDFSGLIYLYEMFTNLKINKLKLGKIGSPDCRYIDKLVYACNELEEIEIEELDVQGIRCINSLIKFCPKLKKLHIGTKGSLELGGAGTLAQVCQSLETIEVGALSQLYRKNK